LAALACRLFLCADPLLLSLACFPLLLLPGAFSSSPRRCASSRFAADALLLLPALLFPRDSVLTCPRVLFLLAGTLEAFHFQVRPLLLLAMGRLSYRARPL